MSCSKPEPVSTFTPRLRDSSSRPIKDLGGSSWRNLDKGQPIFSKTNCNGRHDNALEKLKKRSTVHEYRTYDKCVCRDAARFEWHTSPVHFQGQNLAENHP
jgi:hypothetical protein